MFGFKVRGSGPLFIRASSSWTVPFRCSSAELAEVDGID